MKWRKRHPPHRTFSDLVTKVFRKRMPQIVANILASNTLMKRLTERRG